MYKAARTLIIRCSNVVEQSEPLKGSPFLQQVRWRMRRWAPKNPSKIFYVRTPTPVNHEEAEELKERYAHYRTTMKAIRRTIREEYVSQRKKDDSPVHAENEKRLFEVVLQENEKWNAETAKIRTARQDKIEKEEQEELLRSIIELEERKALEKEANRALVLREKAESKNFITLENLEEEIEKALNTRVSYNFAIDLQGNKYVELPDGSLDMKEADAQDKSQSHRSQLS